MTSLLEGRKIVGSALLPSCHWWCWPWLARSDCGWWGWVSAGCGRLGQA